MSGSDCQRLGHAGDGEYCTRCGKHKNLLAVLPTAQDKPKPPEPSKAVKIGCGVLVISLLIIVTFGIVGAVIGLDETATVQEPTATPRATSTPSPNLRPSAHTGEFSHDALTLRAAMHELTLFKDEPWFHVYCYSGNGPVSSWSTYVSDMDASTYTETGIVPGELWGLGIEYCQNEGGSTDYTEWLLLQMEPAWVNLRPIPTPIPELRVIANQPFASIAYDLATCAWDNPTMYDLFGDDIASSTNVSEFAGRVEAALDGGTSETWDGAITALTICEQTR